MKKRMSSFYTWMVAALLVSATSCTTSRVSQQFTPEQAHQLALEIENTPRESVAAAQTSVQAEFQAAESLPALDESPTEEVLASNTTQDATTEVQHGLKAQVKTQKLNVAQRLVVKAVIKKLEKEKVKNNLRQENSVQKSKKSFSDYKSPLLLGAGGLLLLIIGLAVTSSIVYILGALALSTAVLWAILILADVI
ncbi:hypothetical protein [Xanthocytophaga flava]|uniref:hypothetical protein n=1 Tax=Xanthocytophaga flava TaxID=3048013 RepID=UPI0028D406F5|nr:hypothetical protein [Xanthocytophaga flavus]MDJ1468579.1 hypothetical protein [Xanthocytophaga flavus]